MKIFTLNRTQLSYFLDGYARIRKRGDENSDVKDRSKNPFGIVSGDDVSVRFDGKVYPAKVKEMYVDYADASDPSKRWVALVLAPK